MASTPDHDKPLPTLPKRYEAPKLTTLSVEARNHTRKFILRALEEECLAIAACDREHDNEAWTKIILDALDSLGDSIAQGGWIGGANRSRRASIQRKVILRDIKEEKTITEAVEDPKSVTISDIPVPTPTPDYPPPKSPAGSAMEQMLLWISKSLPSSPKPYPKHILLTAAPFGQASDNVSDFELVPLAVGCVFSPSRFMLHHTVSSSTDAAHEEGTILYGLDEWDVSAEYSDENPIKIVGGSFLLQGLASVAQHTALCKVLRLSIYIYLSAVIEQHLFSDSHVKLNIPKTRPRPAPPPIKHSTDNSQIPPTGEKSPDRSPHTGVWGFLSKKTGSLLNRATSIARHNSLDIRGTTRDTPRRSMDAPHSRSRRISFLADGLPWHTKATKQAEQDVEDHSFRTIVTRIEDFQDLLSTTTGIVFPPPSLLRSIAEREESDLTHRLNPDERIRLHYLLGWEGRDAQAKGMIGIRGFVRHQEFCVLYSEHVSSTAVTRAPSVTSTSSETSTVTLSSLTSATEQSAPVPSHSLCGGRRRWMRFRYYSREDGADKTLGGMIMRMATTAEDQCGNSGCQSKRGHHELDFIHGRTRVSVNIIPLEETVDEERVNMWQSCVECSARTKPVKMSDGTFLLSFGKFLELLVYSQLFHTITPPLCEHTGPVEAKTDAVPSHPGLGISRHFTYRTHQITFTLAAVEEIYNIEVPRVQLLHGAHASKEATPIAGSSIVSSQCASPTEPEIKDIRRILKREMRTWWHTLSERIDNLEQIFQGGVEQSVPLKSLPRIPSSIDLDDEEMESNHSSQVTPKATLSTLPSSSSATQEPETEANSTEGTPRTLTKTLPILPDHETPPNDATPAIPEKPASPPPRPPVTRSDTKLSTNSTSSTSTRSLPKIPHNQEILQLLQNLREDVMREEHSLYSILAKSPDGCLNNVRHAFKTSAKGAVGRMSAWEGKHCVKGTIITSPYPEDPAWWINGNHAIPGSDILINESDWGSMIAFTLSSGDYLAELTSMSMGRSPTLDQPTAPQTPISRPSLFTRSSYRFFGPSRQQPDPDDRHAVWEEPEVYSAVVSRKEHPRDPTSLLSIRDVLRKSSVDTASILSPSRLSPGFSKAGIPPSAWSKPAVEINTLPADGEVVLPENDGGIGQILQEIEATTDDRGLSRNNTTTEATYGTSTSNFSAFESTIQQGKVSSILSTVKSDDVNVKGKERTESSADGSGTAENEQTSDNPPEVPPKPTKPETSVNPAHPIRSGISTGIALVMKQILSTGESTPPPVPRKNYHGLLSLEPPTAEKRPHIKYDWTVGKRLEFSCTVYYAKQFDLLRKRCGIEATYLKSIEQSANWLAEGGKSRSNFWKTADDRFIIKTLVDAWNVADLQVLIELGPSYFKYMESTTINPTILAKLLGFYTIEIKNIESGTVQAKADLLVMENLFFNKEIVKTFDLKGIQGRKVKATTLGNSSKPLFDGDWIEGQQRTPTLLHPHSKLVLQEAIKNDSEFLAKSNIMDYSLLLGIDVERKQIASGLVDTIGSYTFAKTLEYKAKQNLKSGKEVTVIPPNEYQARFVSAMDGYFLACPDKWSKALHDKRDYSDPNVLRSVL